MKLNVYTHAVESVTFPKTVTFIQKTSQSEQILLDERRRKQLKYDT